MSGVGFAVLGATLIGSSDAVARVTSQRIGAAGALSAVFAITAAAMTAAVLATGRAPGWDAPGMGAAAVSGVANAAGSVCLYLALARGPAALVSPAMASFSIFLIAMNVAAGAPVTALQLVAAALVFLGVTKLARPDAPGAAAARREDPARLRATMAIALAAAAVLALRMYTAQEAADKIGTLEALWASRVVAVAAAALIAAGALALGGAAALRGGGASAAAPARPRIDAPVWGMILFQAVCETAALALFLIGGAAEEGAGGAGDRVGAAIGFSAFAAVTPLIAWVWLGEPVSRRRAAWIAVVIASVGLAAYGAPR